MLLPPADLALIERAAHEHQFAAIKICLRLSTVFSPCSRRVSISLGCFWAEVHHAISISTSPKGPMDPRPSRFHGGLNPSPVKPHSMQSPPREVCTGWSIPHRPFLTSSSSASGHSSCFNFSDLQELEHTIELPATWLLQLRP